MERDSEKGGLKLANNKEMRYVDAFTTYDFGVVS